MFENFLADLGERPSLSHTLGRGNHNRGYTCGACDDCKKNGDSRNAKWETPDEQARNKLNTLHVEVDGERRRFCELPRASNVSLATAQQRFVRFGWSLEDALNVPPLPKSPEVFVANGKERARINCTVPLSTYEKFKAMESETFLRKENIIHMALELFLANPEKSVNEFLKMEKKGPERPKPGRKKAPK